MQINRYELGPADIQNHVHLNGSSLFTLPPLLRAFAGDPSQGEVPLLEVFCNPNAYSSPFDAKVLVTVNTSEGVQVMGEATLEQLRAGVDAAMAGSVAGA